MEKKQLRFFTAMFSRTCSRLSNHHAADDTLIEIEKLEFRGGISAGISGQNELWTCRTGCKTDLS
jgi:hypothetical protein